MLQYSTQNTKFTLEKYFKIHQKYNKITAYIQLNFTYLKIRVFLLMFNFFYFYKNFNIYIKISEKSGNFHYYKNLIFIATFIQQNSFK